MLNIYFINLLMFYYFANFLAVNSQNHCTDGYEILGSIRTVTRKNLNLGVIGLISLIVSNFSVTLRIRTFCHTYEVDNVVAAGRILFFFVFSLPINPSRDLFTM